MKKRIGLMLVSFFTGAVLIAAAVAAQQQMHPPMNPPNPAAPGNPPNPPNPPPDPLADVMFPPDLIMSHTRQLKLTDEQKAFMRAEIQKTVGSFQELQWKLQDEMEALHETLKAPSVSEEAALAQLNKVLDIEREIKRLHVGLAVRIKNRLTPEQQEQLHKLRKGQYAGPSNMMHPM